MQRAVRNSAVALVLATTALAATACGSSGGGKQAAADQKQTLTVWGMGTEGEKLGEVAKEYERAHPNITVKVTPVGWDVAHQKLVSAAAAGTLPDIAQMGGTYLGEFADLGVLEPVDTKAFKQDDFFKAGWDQGVADGTAYGVPWYVDTRVLYYRKDLAAKAGITQPPATWQELQEDAAALQKKAGSKWGIYLQSSGLDTVQSFYPFLYSAGGAIVDDDGKAAVNTPAAVKAFDYYGSFFSKGLSRKSVAPGYDVTKDFNTGVVPMFFSGPWHMGILQQQYPQLNGKWAVAPVPADQSSTSMAGGSSLVVSKDSEHKAAAQEFIRYLTGAEGQAEWYKLTADLPANKAAWDSGDLAQSPDLQVFLKQMETAKAAPTLANLTEITSKVDDALGSVDQGKASPKSAADSAQSQVENLLK
ncbi:sugar ABC transporter substrate-binding protein [Actinacidiphila sp. bgisy160]|uniref:sugar ABC transporter substrate-binding protein n=1 Tax=Actinacidiphila sp. bgisy160 TaxID=3413796 RepID=UPI003D705C71